MLAVLHLSIQPENKNMPVPATDIRQESLIRKSWNFIKHQRGQYAQGILVTGPNSFIGTHVVKKLQDQWPGEIHLLVRTISEEEAVVKMQQSFQLRGLGEFDPGRFIIHLGDVCMHMMNLHYKEFCQLQASTGHVIHLAMTPMYHLPYEHFQRIWVPELERMIAFCGDQEHPKFLHYASSFNANFFVDDDDFHSVNTNAWQSGYAGFKWVANQSLMNAMDQHLDACIYDLPLVLGSEKDGICPTYYSIWLILDIFLKTGRFFPFIFNIIPVDILADVMVWNALNASSAKASAFLRPMLDEPVTDRQFARTAANLLGLRESSLHEVREACLNKLRFDFMMPGNFYELMEKVNGLKSVFPGGFDHDKLPTTTMVFISNLNRVMSMKNEVIRI